MVICNGADPINNIKIIAAYELGLQIKVKRPTDSGWQDWPMHGYFAPNDFTNKSYMCKEFNSSHWRKWLNAQIKKEDEQDALIEGIKERNNKTNNI